MAKRDPFDAVRLLYHFTDRRNLDSIRKRKGLYSLAKLEEKGIKIVAPGGNQWSHDADKLKGVDEYIHLSFKSNHPMEYVCRQRGQITDSIYLQIHPSVLYMRGVKFTQDVSNKAGIELYDIGEAREFIDFEVLFTRTNWSDPEIQERLQAAEKCEILVPDFIPITLIRNVPDG